MGFIIEASRETLVDPVPNCSRVGYSDPISRSGDEPIVQTGVPKGGCFAPCLEIVGVRWAPSAVG